mmetsp:Transcript_19227/g.60486  ORF Transcript_19227/g.60486 Transcript_19227/m.60486 type:complete len:500 (+) Transcript_19227:23-1522(+)
MASRALEEPLVEPSQIEEGEPSTVLVVLLFQALTVFGASACGLVHCVNAHEKGEGWAREQVWYMVGAQAGSLALGATCARWLLPQCRRCLAGCWGAPPHGKVEHRWDTAKFTLTQVVAFSHIGMTFMNRVWWGSWYQTFKEFWLMQTYFFISGYLSSPIPTRKRLQAVWRSLVGAYVINQTLYFVLDKIVYKYGWSATRLQHTYLAEYSGRGDVMHQNFLLEFWLPTGPLWYLPNLLALRLVAPWWLELRWPLATAVVLQCLILSLKEDDFDTRLSFMSIGDLLSMGLPWYVLGVKARPYSTALNAVFDWSATWWASLGAFATGIALCYLNTAHQLGRPLFGIYAERDIQEPAKRQWFNAYSARLTSSFETTLAPVESAKMHLYLTYAWWLVVGGNAIRLVLAFAAVRLFSRANPVRIGPLDVTAMGKRSISNYLMHWYVFICLQLTSFDTDQWYGPLKILALILLVILQSLFWMSLPVYRILRPVFLAPDMDRLLLPP